MHSSVINRIDRLRSLLVLLLALSLAACGFHLRGLANLPFQSVYISGSASIVEDLKKSFSSSGVKVLPSPEGAQALVEFLSETNEKRILSLSGGGKVSEYELVYMLSYRARLATATEWGPEQRVEMRRAFTYDDTQLLAKSYEEARLSNDLHADAVREVVRRLSVIVPQ